MDSVINVHANGKNVKVKARVTGEVYEETLRRAFLLENDVPVALLRNDVALESRRKGENYIFDLGAEWKDATYELMWDEARRFCPSMSTIHAKKQEQIEKQEVEALRASPAYAYWVKKIFPRVLYTYVDGFKRCVIPFFRNFGLTYRHGKNKNLVNGDKIMIYPERNENFGEPFEASVVDFDDSLDVVLLKAPVNRVFTSEDFCLTAPKEGSHYIMIGFSNPDAPTIPRISLGSVLTVAYEAFGELRFYGSSGSCEGDSGAGCYDRFGRLLGINVSVVCTPVNMVENMPVVQLNGGKNAVTPAICIHAAFKKHLPAIEKRNIIE